jgi:hypothetical protein
MTHDDHEHHEFITIAEFFDEYGMVVFFGSFFLMTMFLPLLFSENLQWLFWALTVTLCIALGLLTIPGLMAKNKKKQP